MCGFALLLVNIRGRKRVALQVDAATLVVVEERPPSTHTHTHT